MAMTMNRNNRLDKAGDTPSFGDSCQCETILQFSGKPCGANICLWCSRSDNSCSESHCNLSSLSFYPPQASHSRWCDPNQSEKRSQNFKAKKSIGSENLIKNFAQLTSNDWKAPLGDTNSHFLRRFAHHHNLSAAGFSRWSTGEKSAVTEARAGVHWVSYLD